MHYNEFLHPGRAGATLAVTFGGAVSIYAYSLTYGVGGGGTTLGEVGVPEPAGLVGVGPVMENVIE